jgi:hypothetical protein
MLAIRDLEAGERKKKWRWRGESRFAKLPLCFLSSSPPAAKEQERREGKGKKKKRCLFFIPKVSPSFWFP